MNHLEAYNKIRNRVEWDKSLDTRFEFITYKTPESGRFLQEEHPSVRIEIVYETMFDVDISNADFESKLEYIKQKAILQMLHDVFSDQKDILDYWIDGYVGLFDYAIILKNSSNVMFDVMNSTRINLTETVTDDNLKRWFIDLNGLKDSVNGVYTQSFLDRYRREIDRIRKVLFIRNKSMKVVTAR
ncbi:hypothetical protein QLS91_12980 [Flavobacterium sp. LB2P84]|uniref:hypothetical protein n=1 Tax=Flavobacterium yafengii TaxID=3041253 RepID=UPI0024A8A40C|nr:hypothetical protein [Flavobacterium yafengii]MDI6033988.1 hypothetical protein [Flavobacterium yafengii]